MNYVISIINPKALPVVTDICTELGLPMTVVVMGHGTAVRSMLDLLGIESTENASFSLLQTKKKQKSSLKSTNVGFISVYPDTESSYHCQSKASEEAVQWHTLTEIRNPQNTFPT